MALKYSACYAEESATLVGYDRNTAMSVGKAVRVFKDRIPAESIDAVIREMWGARLYVNRPMIDRRGTNSDEYRLAGLWRVADLRKNDPQEEGPAIIETLVYGWMTAGTDATTWAANDLESRLSAFREYNVTPVKDVMGINRTYLVVYPNVAYTSHKAFVTALLVRGDVVDPIFGKAAKLVGTFLFTSAKAQETEDGGCMVIATLTLKGTTTDITNAAVSFASTWEKSEFRLFWTGLTSLPGTLPPAVDLPNRTAYEVSGFDLDAESGTYTITYNKTIFIKSVETSSWSSANGAPTVENFWNYTKDELDSEMGSFLTTAYNNSASWTKHPLIALYSGTLTRRVDTGSSEVKWPAWKDTTLKRYSYTYHQNYSGAWKETMWTIYYTMEQGTGQSTGVGALHFKDSGMPVIPVIGGVPTAKVPMDVAACGAHSRFERISGDRYFYEAVWKVEKTTVDLTSASASSGYEGTEKQEVGEKQPAP